MHDRKVELITGAYDSETGIFTFETDRFSTYALVYDDGANETNTTVSDNVADLNEEEPAVMDELEVGYILDEGDTHIDENTETQAEENPAAGVAVGVVTALVAGVAVLISRKRKMN